MPPKGKSTRMSNVRDDVTRRQTRSATKASTSSTSPPDVTDAERNPDSLPRDHVSRIVWEPGILTGYRPMGKPWFYYINSLFRIHNETGNIWSHLVGPIFIFGLVYLLRSEVDFYNNPSAHGLLVFAAGTSCQMFCSAMAHLLHSRSEAAHYLLFCFDYMGIGMYSCGHGMMTFYCSGNSHFYQTLGAHFHMAMVVIATSCTLGNSAARTLYWKPCFMKKFLQVFPCLVSFTFCQVPVLFRVYECWGDVPCTDDVNHYHTLTWVLMLIDGALFSLHQPERAFPGMFDIWGHGHQLFHIGLLIGTLFILYASYLDLLVIPAEVLLKAQPDVVTIWTSFCFVLLANLGIVVLFNEIYKRRPIKAE